jgi:hypothetical protein
MSAGRLLLRKGKEESRTPIVPVPDPSIDARVSLKISNMEKRLRRISSRPERMVTVSSGAHKETEGLGAGKNPY